MKTFRLKRARACFCLSLIVLLFYACATGKCADKAVYLHVLQSHNVLGPIDLLASPDIAVVKLRKLDCIIYLYSENQKGQNTPSKSVRMKGNSRTPPVVLVLSPPKKLYYQVPLDKFNYSLSTTLETISDIESNPKYWKPQASSTVSGQTVTEFRYQGRVGVYEHHMPYLPGKMRETTVESRITTLKSPLITEALSQLLKKMEHEPALGGIPYARVTVYSNGKPRKQLSTEKVRLELLERQTLPSLSGWKKTEKSTDVFYSRLNMLDSLLGD